MSEITKKLEQLVHKIRERAGIKTEEGFTPKELRYIVEILRAEYTNGKIRQDLEEAGLREIGIDEDIYLFAVLEGLGIRNPDTILKTLMYIKGIVPEPPPELVT